MPQTTNRHPCYDEGAHYSFARMHVAVAPACNIRCKYCNRKFDCVSESRPGVVSQVLTPSEAYTKVEQTVASLPRLTVVGIAGPGDPLANPEATFETFRLLAESGIPDLELCLSSNGLKLADYADEIEKYGIRHVTVTCNAVDPAVGAKIYDRIFYRGKVYRGEEAAAILLERQLTGIREMAARGIRTKVNAVLIPGVNEDHLETVAKAVKDAGAFSFNIMPLIISPGSLYEKEGVKEPEPALTLKVQEQCSTYMPLMRHCRQCRADAVGLLGEDDRQGAGEANKPAARVYSSVERQTILDKLDREMESRTGSRKPSSESRSEGIKVAVATRGGGKINAHFGHAKEFLIYEVAGSVTKLLGVRKVQAYCNGTAECPTKETKSEILESTIRMLEDCSLLLCSGIGPAPEALLKEADIVPLIRKGDIVEQLIESTRFFRYFNKESAITVS